MHDPYKYMGSSPQSLFLASILHASMYWHFAWAWWTWWPHWNPLQLRVFYVPYAKMNQSVWCLFWKFLFQTVKSKMLFLSFTFVSSNSFMVCFISHLLGVGAINTRHFSLLCTISTGISELGPPCQSPKVQDFSQESYSCGSMLCSDGLFTVSFAHLLVSQVYFLKHRVLLILKHRDWFMLHHGISIHLWTYVTYVKGPALLQVLYVLATEPSTILPTFRVIDRFCHPRLEWSLEQWWMMVI